MRMLSKTMTEYFEEVKENSLLVTFWLTTQDEDEEGYEFYVTDILTDYHGDLKGLMLNDENTDDGADYYPIGKIRSWRYSYSRQVQ